MNIGKRKYIKISFLIGSYILIVLSTMSQFILKHEQVHEQIFRYFGMETNMTLCFYGLCGGSVNATFRGVPDEKISIVMSLQAVNEVVNYQYTFLLIMMFSLLFLNLVMVVRNL